MTKTKRKATPAKPMVTIAQVIGAGASQTRKLKEPSKKEWALIEEWSKVVHYLDAVSLTAAIPEKKIRECIRKAGIKDVEGFLKRHSYNLSPYTRRFVADDREEQDD